MKRKKIGLIALTAIAGLSLASCGNNNGGGTTAGESLAPGSQQTPIIDMAETDKDSKFSLEKMILDTSKTKLDYYLGDTIDLSGLKVSCSFIKYKPEFERIEKEVTGFYYDLSTVDMTTVGDKELTIYYREGVQIAQDNVIIRVKSSVLETSGKEYVGGIECDVQVKEYLLNDTFSKPIINKLVLHKFTGNKETSTESIRLRNCETEFAYNEGDKLTKTGDFLYKISYTEEIDVNGTKVTNKVTTYIIIRVKNDVTAISFESGQKSFAATVKALDLSSWKISVTREVGGTTVESFNTSEYRVKGINTIVEGTYTAIIEHIASSKFAECEVTITASTTADIYVGALLQDTMDKTADDNGIQYLDADHKVFVKNITKSEAKAASYGTLSFDTRISIKGTTGLVGVNMPKGGTIIVYIASSNNEAREIQFLDKDLSLIQSFLTSDIKQEIREYVVDVAEGGTYYFAIPSAGYVHGVVIATEK